MQITQQKTSLTSLAGLKAATIIGIAVVDNKLFTMTCDLPTTIAGKLAAEIPTWQLPATEGPMTFIKSVQVRNGLLVVETQGPLTTLVKEAIDAIMTHMATHGMVTAFFPATNTPGTSQFYYGNVTDNLRNVARGLINVRLMDNSDTILFTQEGKPAIYALPAKRVDEEWMKAALPAHVFSQEVSFLGRVQDAKVDIVLKDGNAFRLKLNAMQTPQIKKSSLLEQGVSAVFGTILATGSTLLAAIRGQELVLIPVTSSTR